MKTKHIAVFASTFFTLACPVNAQGKLVHVDKRNASSSTHYFVSFCSRESPNWTKLPGHCYMAWETQVDGGPRIGAAFGFSPVTGGFGLIVGPGDILPETVSTGSSTDQDCTVEAEVDQSIYNQTETLRESKRNSTFVLGNSDCVDFCNQTARVIGLNIPASTTLMRPDTYISQLYDTNSGVINPPH